MFAARVFSWSSIIQAYMWEVNGCFRGYSIIREIFFAPFLTIGLQCFAGLTLRRFTDDHG